MLSEMSARTIRRRPGRLANFAGPDGLERLVERDPDFFRPGHSTDEVVRIRQQVGLYDRLNADMQPGRQLRQRSRGDVRETVAHRSGQRAPPQQFIYQPAVDKVLREGVERFPNVTVVSNMSVCACQHPDGVELMLADLTTDQFRRIRAKYVIASDGGSRPSADSWASAWGRTFSERWIVIDTKVRTEWPGHDHQVPLQPRTAPQSDRLPHSLGHHRWEFLVRDEEDEKAFPHRRRHLESPVQTGESPRRTSDHRLRLL